MGTETYLRGIFDQSGFTGFKPGLPFDAYAMLPGINASMLKKRTPADMRAALDERDMTIAELYETCSASTLETWATGQAIHKAILEPDAFDTEMGWREYFAFSPTKGLNTKAALEALLVEPTRPLITPEILETARRARDAVWVHPLLASILVGCRKEVSAFCWEAVGAGNRRKLRLDALPNAAWWKAPVPAWPIDLKSVTSEGYDSFRWNVKKHGYFIQAAFYLDTVNLLNGGAAPEPGFHFIIVTKEKPFKAKLVTLTINTDEGLLESGYRICADRIGKFCACAAEEIAWRDAHPGEEPDFKTLRKFWPADEAQTEPEFVE